MNEKVRIYRGEQYRDPGGFVIVPRRAFIEDPLLQIKPWHPWIFWQFIIYLCVWDKAGKTISRDGEVVHLERGQAFYSLRFLGEAAGFGKDKVRQWLNKFAAGVVPSWLKEGPRIRHEALHKGTLITVLNYDPYQDINFYAQTPDQTRNQTPEEARSAGHRDHNQASNQTRNQTQTRQTPDTDQTNKNAVSMQLEQLHARARETQRPDTARPGWKEIRGSRELEFWDTIPVHVRHMMLVDALASELPPPELAQWVLDEIDLLEIPVDAEMYQQIEDAVRLDADNPAIDGPDPETELRQKLAALTSGRR